MFVFLNRFHLHWKGRCNFTLYMGQCSFLLTVLAFRCPLSLYSQIDIGCRIKIVAVFVSIHFLGTNPPTQIQEVCQRHLSKTNSHLHQMQATKNNQSTQRGVKKFSSPKRTPTRHSAAKDFSVWRQACFIMAPKTGRSLLWSLPPSSCLFCSKFAWLRTGVATEDANAFFPSCRKRAVLR